MRVVDLDAVIDCIEVEWGYEGIREVLYSLPVVDAVPVVRCRKCKNFRQNNENDPYCADRRGLDDPEPESFCSYGEPKEKHSVQ